jgi:hypothetical protein
VRSGGSSTSVGKIPAQPAAARPPAASGQWILSPWKDLVLFVATPLLILPLLALAQLRFTAEEIGLVGVLGARGHHLPGMLRAYGDRELFQRYRLRFILAPIFLLAVCGWLAHTQIGTLGVVFLLWGLWHGLAQVYGFMRIYDAKVGARSPWRARIDMSMCVAWFVGGVLHSPDKVADVLALFYQSGGPLLASFAVDQVRLGWDVLTGVVTAAFVVYTLVRWRAGQPCSYVKLFAMTSSFSFWWFAMVYLKEIILGVAVFEIFHDVQYLSIVWVFNRTRVDKGRPVGAFTQFLFRPSTMMMTLYLGLVVAYGCATTLDHVFIGENLKLALYALVMASTFLHYYYDGFIWKIREPTTSEGLGMQGSSAKGARRQAPGWFVHGLKWSAFVLPVGWSIVYPLTHQGLSSAELKQALVASVPDCARAQESLATELAARGDTAEAQLHLQDALRLKPDSADAHLQLGKLLALQNRVEDAAAHFQQALLIKPNDAEAHNSLGSALARQGRLKDAADHYQQALRCRPDYPLASENLRRAEALLGQQNEPASQ